MDPTFYEDVFVPTSVEELDFVRTPFYDLAKLEHLKEGEEAQKFLTNIQMKAEMVDAVNALYQSPAPTKETISFTRYADELVDKEVAEKLQ